MEIIDNIFDFLFGWMPNWLLFIIVFVLIAWALESHIRSIVKEEISNLENRVDDLESRTHSGYSLPNEPPDID